MRRLVGINNSTIIDDTYNASPEAVSAALKTLYRLDAPQKIAVLGNMNELGKFSAEAHRQIGEQCDPKQLDLVVTIGPDANKYLAPAAEKKGCKVGTFSDPYQAGEFVKLQIKPGALVLVKGSQNKVFAEEAVKTLLADPVDASKLVRQSRYWMKIKAKNFKWIP
jgi:UDP-N-acetylmuramoyl-tripeptide--D-alanyl-D-alanine ligase